MGCISEAHDGQNKLHCLKKWLMGTRDHPKKVLSTINSACLTILIATRMYGLYVLTWYVCQLYTAVAGDPVCQLHSICTCTISFAFIPSSLSADKYSKWPGVIIMHLIIWVCDLTVVFLHTIEELNMCLPPPTSNWHSQTAILLQLCPGGEARTKWQSGRARLDQLKISTGAVGVHNSPIITTCTRPHNCSFIPSAALLYASAASCYLVMLLKRFQKRAPPRKALGYIHRKVNG